VDRNLQGGLLFDWGDTLMRDFKGSTGPMKDWPRREALPGAAEMLATLHPGWTLALATNELDSDEADIRAALKQVNLEQWLDKVYCFKNIGHRKPSCKFFEYILDDLKLARESVCMVGDNFEVDVLGANACGLRAVWFNEHSPENRTDHLHRTIHTLGDLPETLEGFM
jgi:FMN phosphatase YigB (HAD superfamily)